VKNVLLQKNRTKTRLIARLEKALTLAFDLLISVSDGLLTIYQTSNVTFI